MNKVLKNYTLNLLYQIAVTIIPILLIPVISRRLGASTLGIYSYITSVVNVLIIIGMIGLSTYSAREIAYNNYSNCRVKMIFQELFIIRVYLLFGITIMYILIIVFSNFKVYFFIYYLFVLGTFLDISYLFIGIEKMKTIVLKNFGIKVINFFLVILFVKDSQDLWLYFLFTGISTLFGILVMFPSAIKYFYGIKFIIPIDRVKYHILGSLKLFLPQMASLLYVQCDKLILMWLSTSTILGYYEQCEKIAKMPVALMTALTTILMPRIANSLKQDGIKSIDKYLNYGLLVLEIFMIPMMIGLIFLHKDFLILYLGKEFEQASFLFAIIILCIFPICLSNITGSQFLVALNETKILTISYIFAALFNIICNCVLVPFMGGVGAALATVFAEWIVVFIQGYYLKRRYQIYFKYKRIAISILLSTIMGIIVVLIGNLLPLNYNSVIKLIIQFITGIVIYYSLYLIINKRKVIGLFKK